MFFCRVQRFVLPMRSRKITSCSGAERAFCFGSDQCSRTALLARNFVVRAAVSRHLLGQNASTAGKSLLETRAHFRASASPQSYEDMSTNAPQA